MSRVLFLFGSLVMLASAQAARAQDAVGACCLDVPDAASCTVMTEADCLAMEGQFAGAGSVCMPGLACPQGLCAGFAGWQCEPGLTCVLMPDQCSTADALGVCIDMPSGGCPEIYLPVCGCDQRTYVNPCEAMVGGVAIDHYGPCDGQVCRGILSVDCTEPGEFCKFPPGTCNDDALPGMCEPIPEGCPDVWDPVCGCDGITYGNECEADAVQARIAYAGSCVASDVCGGPNEIPCLGLGDFCKIPVGACLDPSIPMGTCTPIPITCPFLWDPVCGCDGDTYANECLADQAGVPVAFYGECDPVLVCGGTDGVLCPENMFCKLPAGTCHIDPMEGVCTPIPEVCSMVFDPVCGCDGITYGNACEADRAGAQIDHAGICAHDYCWSNEMCAWGEYCYYEDCALESGVCLPRPLDCTLCWEPVCGCDGQTYANACIAAMEGVSVDYVGVCENQEACGGVEQIPCSDADQFCLYPTGTCGNGEIQGICTTPPNACPEYYDPVCGCDGLTYDNECFAYAAGVSIRSMMACEEEGCFHNESCEDDQYCLFPACGFRRGVCTDRPVECPGVWEPVCGCDGQTYANECVAAMAGVSVDHAGECESVMCWENSMCDLEDYCFFAHCGLESGICLPRPTDCPDLYEPVCGCDGVTYTNACFAAVEGVSIDYIGVCEAVVCTTNDDCYPYHYCLKEDGDCDGIGICTQIPPPHCALVEDPVCGCDGQTYMNRCFAESAGVSVMHEGPCPVPCEINDECGPLEFCLFETEDCAPPGVCAFRPGFCVDAWAPVCGCDGQTYGNACWAHAAGVNIDYEGACASAYCWANDMCDESDYCYFADCDLETGVCMPRPDICPPIWLPVCGCDGNTYPNECVAALEGMSVDYEGECAQDYCWSNDMCDDADYCFFHVCAVETGVCVARPTVCPDIWDPVCGCDGITYANECIAALQGMSVDHEGACEQDYCWTNEMCDDADYCYYEDCGLEMGYCVPRPTDCPWCWDPVCGCDGETYPNECIAAWEGMSVDYVGVCAGHTCVEHGECAEGHYCAKNMGDCEGEGYCTEIPDDPCPMFWAPVCGCDGQTYSNTCWAQAAGVNVDHEGECGPAMCGTRLGIECPDPENEFCKYIHGTCGADDLPGVCTPYPQGCPDVWDPVCGCDGVTYGNECESDMAGISVLHDGVCVDECTSNEDCDGLRYCHFDDGACAGTGACLPVPSFCPDIGPVVCGCDGVTYDNACFAHRARTSVAHEGACQETCTSDDDCWSLAFCHYEDGHCGDIGTCVVPPDACPDVWDPVCGCDYQTYSNYCEALVAEVSVLFYGECGETCGGLAGIECDNTEEEFCKLVPGYCRAMDPIGVCLSYPAGCPDVWDPVCGCDGVTYGNSCEAESVGVNILHWGTCEPIECTVDDQCPSDHYCFKMVNDCEGEGICQPIYTGPCSDLWEPVCGCDGVTYHNICFAARAGVSVDYVGACATELCFTDEDCGTEHLFCNYPEGTCGAGGYMGQCTYVPQACAPIDDPVCGCDEVTYANECEAQMARMSVLHQGVCDGRLAELIDSSPADGKSLWRQANNVARLRFDGNLEEPPTPGQILIQIMFPDGVFSRDLSALFTFTIEDGNVLRIEENGAVLQHGTWYAVRNLGNWSGVEPFDVHWVLQIGDANNDLRVLPNDLSLINEAVPTFGAPDDARRDITGEGHILPADLSAANAHVPSFEVPMPSGHGD